MSNSMVDLKKFLSTPDRPVLGKEMIEFWNSLSEEEKEEYREADLGK